MNLADYKNGRIVFVLEKYNYKGVRFLYKKGSTNKLFTFFHHLPAKGKLNYITI